MRTQIIAGVALTVVLLTQSSCAVVAGWGLGSAISQKQKKTRAEFTAKFNQTNADREAKKLPPLEWCTAVYRFDRSWAKQDPVCKAKIKSYESGDLAALPEITSSHHGQ